MEKNVKRIFGLMLSIALIVCCCPVSVFTAFAATEIPEISEDEYYGKHALRTLPNGENLVYAYEQIAKGVEQSSGSIKMYDSAHSITRDEIITVYTAYNYDYPQHFWHENSYSYSYFGESGMISNLMLTYNMTGNGLISAKQEFSNAVNEVVSGVSNDMNEYDREKLIHDRLADRIEYVADAANAHNAYGGLVEGRAVCDGYAKAFQYALYKVGIQSTTVAGEGKTSSGSGGHAWNLVRIDGNYYYTDLSWNDQSPTIFYAYFNLPLSEMSEDHILYATGYDFPECTSTDANYFTLSGGRMEDYSVEQMVKLLKKNLVAEVYLTGDTSGFTEWLRNNMSVIAAKCGITGGYSYSYSVMGREYIIKLNGTRQTVSVQGVKTDISSYTFGNIGDTFKLGAVVSPSDATNETVTFTSSNTEVAVVNKYTGIVTAVGEGAADIIVTTEDGNKTAVCKVTVRELAITLKGNGSTAGVSCEVGETVELVAEAVGGNGDYTYSYLLHNIDTNAWYRFSDFKSANTLSWKASGVGNREFFAEVKDKTGQVVRSKSLKVKVQEANDLKITGKSSVARVRVGENVTFTGLASGGSGNYTYSYLVHNKDNGEWYRFSGFKASNSLTWNAGSTGNRDFYVEVKDSSGKVVRSSAINVQTIEKNALDIVGKSNLTSTTEGTKVVITGEASGGSGKYTYSFLLCNKDTGAWYRFSGFQASSSLVWTAGSAGNREFYVEVKDETGKVVRSPAIKVTVR